MRISLCRRSSIVRLESQHQLVACARVRVINIFDASSSLSATPFFQSHHKSRTSNDVAQNPQKYSVFLDVVVVAVVVQLKDTMTLVTCDTDNNNKLEGVIKCFAELFRSRDSIFDACTINAWPGMTLSALHIS